MDRWEDQHLRRPGGGESKVYVAALSLERLRELAEESGVTPEALQRLGVGWAEADKSWTIPERDGTGVVIGITRRYAGGRQKAMPGVNRGLISPDGLADMPDPVLAVEGASDVAACVSLGLAAICRPSSSGGADHLGVAVANRRVLVIGENDKKEDGKWPGRDGAVRVTLKLASARGGPVAWALPPGSANDVRSWLNGCGVSLADRAVLAAEGQRLLEAFNANAVMVDPLVDANEIATGPYFADGAGLVWMKPTQNGPVPVRLTNFVAVIVADTERDDGQEVVHLFENDARSCAGARRSHRFTVAASAFYGLTWVYDRLGASAIIYPEYPAKDHTRCAIQPLSINIRFERIFTHSCWREVEGKWIYLHSGGAIGANGLLEEVQTDLPESLAALNLPAPPGGDELCIAVRASLELLDLGPDPIMIPIVAAIYRAVLGPPDFAIHLAGRTGTFKTEIATLAQRHFGIGFNARSLPGSWSSTGNSLESQAFFAKDAVFVVDDLCPTGSSFDVARTHKEADRVIRAQGNRSGRGRLASDGTIRRTRAPRGLIISTGEGSRRGESLRARMPVIEIAPGDIKADALTVAQANANAGLFSASMSGYLRWLASRYREISEDLRRSTDVPRAAAVDSRSHKRTPHIVG